mmetsp:Transcript_33913/g.58255  ORF Transcript_33913/g.58255 Transcript_33913/m.58255 type:complete len:177 (-) Transcript_33913:157-687(-)|eukprot:CAMPEP_0185001062 /NCGR_PEP_ID=MMETSP1098-20130426/70038_1 /TAXON_ID=89044 /ORGANISM="Spumella elongata, Strain CCAP 955/1" /LENGTH=176 /DNA_ID=CAMNT_0027528317 /DNA_START=21 /DNA_END=551 /DNA_ORIENTATION=+
MPGVGHGGHSGRNRARQIANFQHISAGAPYVLRADGGDSFFGCPCMCSGASLKCSFDHAFLPHELNGIVSFADYSVMVTELDQALKSTHLPVFPLILIHFLIPFSPICAMSYYSSKRVQKTRKILHKYNDKMAGSGYFWEIVAEPDVVKAIAILRFNGQQQHGGMVPIAVAEAVPV